MNIELHHPNAYTRELSIDLPWEELSESFEAAVKRFGKRVKMPGFRMGKVPRKVLLRQYQPAIEADFVEDSIQTYYSQALKEQGLVPVNQGDVSDVHFQNGDHFSFKVTFEVEPQVKLPRLKKNSLKVKKTLYVTDAVDGEEAVADIRRAHVEVHTVEDGAVEGDFVIADLQELDPSGVAVIGRKLEKQYLQVGSGPGGGENRAKLEGLRGGQTARIEIPSRESLPPSRYEVQVINVERQILPEVDLEFVRRLDPGAEDVATWREDLARRIQASYDRRSQEAFERQLADALIDLSDPAYPPSMLESYLDHLVKELKSGDGRELDEKKVRQVNRPLAERNLRWYLVRKALIEQEGFQVTAAEVEGELEKRIESNPSQASKIRSYYRQPHHRSRLEDDLMEKKIFTHLNKFTQVQEEKIPTADLRRQESEEAS